MTSAAELLALADRIEREEGSRELDRKISRFFAKHFYEFWRERIGDNFTTGAPFDLTAAMYLVPKAYDRWRIEREHPDYERGYLVWLVPSSGMVISHKGTTVKSALCAAALRAWAAEIER